MTNPLMEDLKANDAFPDISLSLPSSNVWYSDDVFVQGADTTDLTIKVLGIIAEQSYRDPLMMITGEGIVRLVKNVCPEVLKPMELFEMDLEAILLASRIASYGPKMILDDVCQFKKDENEEPCNHENKIELDLNEIIQRYEPLTDEDIKEYEYSLKSFNQKVLLRPFPYWSVIELLKTNLARDNEIEKMQSTLSEEDSISDLILSNNRELYSKIADMNTQSAIDSVVSSIFCVESSSGQRVNDPKFIKEWLLNIPTSESDGIVKRINELSEKSNKRTNIVYDCGGCGNTNTTNLVLDANKLFTYAGASEIEKKSSQKSTHTTPQRRIR